MNITSYLDPPDHPEPPECCGDYMSVYEDGSCKCPTCGGPPAWDPDFNTADFPMMMRFDEMPTRYRKHFLGS